MPIFVLRFQSMPSIDSRKPCTKCVRNCSPSDTVSMPASSSSLIQTSAASRLAAASASPSRRHFGQSFSVSASQPGFGRQPAMVGGNSKSASLPAGSVNDDAADRLALVHQVESLVDLVELQGVGDHRVDLDLA